MKKDFNITPDSIDLLLKQAFLKLDENNLSGQKLNDILAGTILNSNKIINVNTSKEKELFQKINAINKKGFFTRSRLWSGAFLLIAGICLLSYFYFKNPKNVNKQVITTHALNRSIPEVKTKISLTTDTLKNEGQIKSNKEAVVLNKDPLINPFKAIDKKEQGIKNNDTETFRYYEPNRCVILLPSHCCYCIPTTSKPKFATSVDSSGIEFDRIDCGSLYQMKDISCIWLTLTTKENSYLKLEDQLKNFALLKGMGKEIHPFLVKVTNDLKLWTADFKGKTVTVNYNKQIDVLLFFKNADPKIGSRIRINKHIAIIKAHDVFSRKS